MLRRTETAEGQATLIADWQAHGDWRLAERYLERAMSVTADQLRDAAARYLTTERATLLLYRPRSALRLATDADDVRSRILANAVSSSEPTSARPVTVENIRPARPPRLTAHLVRNRRGHLGAWILEWNSVEQRLELATRPEPVAGAAFDRPHRAAAV